jgi:hypothetical protein
VYFAEKQNVYAATVRYNVDEELLFLSYYCDYIVIKIVIFLFLSFFSLKLLIFGGQMWGNNKPGKILAADPQTTENKTIFGGRALAAET